MNDTIIEFKNVSKSFRLYYDRNNQIKDALLTPKRNKYTNKDVLKDVSFQIHKGEAVGLIGTNGCGKSTTLKLLSRIMYPNSGSIIINGKVSALIELGAGFHPDMSGYENIYINASILGLKKKEIDQIVDDIIDFSELKEAIYTPVRTYSSGMYMRLAFAVAINVHADILLIDEILAVGDVNFQSKCLKKLKEIKEKGTTIVLVSHSVDQVKSLCEKVIWLNDGHIEMEGDCNSVCDAYLNSQIK